MRTLKVRLTALHKVGLTPTEGTVVAQDDDRGLSDRRPAREGRLRGRHTVSTTQPSNRRKHREETHRPSHHDRRDVRRRGTGEAARLTGKALNTEYNNVAQGSLDAYCPKVPGRRDFRRCYYTYYDDGGGCWSGATAIRNVSYTRFRYRILWDDRCY